MIEVPCAHYIIFCPRWRLSKILGESHYQKKRHSSVHIPWHRNFLREFFFGRLENNTKWAPKKDPERCDFSMSKICKSRWKILQPSRRVAYLVHLGNHQQKFSAWVASAAESQTCSKMREFAGFGAGNTSVTISVFAIWFPRAGFCLVRGITAGGSTSSARIFESQGRKKVLFENQRMKIYSESFFPVRTTFLAVFGNGLPSP